MEKHTEKRIAKVKPHADQAHRREPWSRPDKPWIAWDDKLTGFGGPASSPRAPNSLSSPTAPGGGGCKASNKRVVIERYGCIAAIQVRR